MYPYWLLFLYFATGAVLSPEVDEPRARGAFLLSLGGVIIALMIGLRYHVGGDWITYSGIFAYAQRTSASDMVNIFGDPAYTLLTWGVSNAGGAIWQVNIVCGIIFAWGLVRFARAQLNPWLAMTIAIPYLVVVVAMGYSRQAVAIGILMAGLAAVSRGASTLHFARYVIVAALFHKTAAMVLPIMAFAQERNRAVNVFVGLALSVVFYDLFLSESMSFLYRVYIKGQFSSQGAAIRVILSAIPSALYLVSRRRFGFTPAESKLWFYFSVTSLALFVALLALPSSTAIDRMALYVIPVQMAILSRVNVAYRLHRFGRVLVVGFEAAVLFTWLNFAVYAQYWLPYRLYPIFG